MSTLLHLMLWITVTLTGLAVGTVLIARWAWRRVRGAAAARLGNVVRSFPSGRSCRGRRRTSSDSDFSVPAGFGTPAGVRLRAAIPGAGRDVAIIRRDLRADVAAAGRAVSAGRQAGRPVDGLAGIVRRLQEQGAHLDIDLSIIGTEPDRHIRRRLLAAQDERVALLRRACGDVRRGVLLAGGVTTGPLLQPVVDDLNDEVTALGLWASAYAELTAR